VTGFSDASARYLVHPWSRSAIGEAHVSSAKTIEENALRVLDDERAGVQLLLPVDHGPLMIASGTDEDARAHDRGRGLRLASLDSKRHETEVHDLPHVQGSPDCSLATWPLVHEGRLVGVLEVRAPSEVIRSKRQALQALVDISGALLNTAARAAETETSVRQTEELLSVALASNVGWEEALGNALQLCSRVLQMPIVAWMRRSPSDDPAFLDAYGQLTAGKARTLRRRVPVVSGHELEPPAGGRAVAARVSAMLDSDTWPIVCREDALLIACGTPKTSEREFQVIRGFLEMAITLAVANAAVERKSRRLDIALGTAVHELRAPLAVSRSLLDLLLERNLAPSEGWIGLLRKSRSELSHLLSICDTFLRWDMAVEPKVTAEADVGKVLREVTAESHVQSAARGRIRIHCPSDLRAVADEQLLRVSVANLVRNALDHSPEDGLVELSALRWSDRIAIEVTDQGPGVAPEERERIFDPFIRSKASRARGAGGAGLGLFIARRLIEAQRGSIEVLVTEEGTTFRVLIPTVSEQTAGAPSLCGAAARGS
jgi:signal transduction histidine kinase